MPALAVWPVIFGFRFNNSSVGVTLQEGFERRIFSPPAVPCSPPAVPCQTCCALLNASPVPRTLPFPSAAVRLSINRPPARGECLQSCCCQSIRRGLSTGCEAHGKQDRGDAAEGRDAGEGGSRDPAGGPIARGDQEAHPLRK